MRRMPSARSELLNMNITVASVLGLALLAVLLVLIAGMALCAHFDSNYFDGGDDEIHP